ncbi:N-acetyl-1-D-myo-inositol-2-amino-2-deoxy-alpha-D-glucopyranoside deacetylase [Pedococcus sp. NPDC057267]|uniref:N-acetyl-1-D-myo-inositol-2-amino-2-deoxy-alpha- D-glucopyranoside deacetylase n=1 Tax=Pedococcus sp. NPDC057267 TaxID=3346077 RepID=UPI003634B079
MSRPPLLFVHAHPDDETLTTGLTMAHHVRAGHLVHVLTCTLGEEGEVIPPELLHLDAAHDDVLGPYRAGELARAMSALGTTWEVLGADPARGALSRYRDSGMAGTPSAANPAAFVNADLAEAAALVADVVRRLRPAAVVTYDAQGGYGHPDHIQTHRVTCAAVASLPAGEQPLLYAVLTPQSWAREDREWLAAHPELTGRWSVPPADGDYPPSVVPDALVTHVVQDLEALPVQREALSQHVTQVTVRGDVYALSNDIAARLPGREGFARLDPATGRLATAPVSGPGRRADRVAGLLDGSS